MECQDWKTVVLKKNKNNKDIKKERDMQIKRGQIAPEVVAKKTTTHTPSKQLFENDIPTIKCLSKEASLMIQKSRMDKKWTQEQLAKNCNMNVSVIKSIESGNGKTVYNPSEINVVSRVLGITVPRP